MPVEARPAPPTAAQSRPEARLHERRFRAMGCQMAAWVASSEAAAAAGALAELETFFQVVERRLSRFQPASELSQLNARPDRPIVVSPWLWCLLRRALAAARGSGGLFDPTVLDALEAAGYDRSFEQLPPRGPPPERPGRPGGWERVRLDRRRRTVTLPSDLRLDLGGLAKGWAADRAAARLARLGPCLVDAGGDLAARGAPPTAIGWAIGLASPLQPDLDLALLAVRDRGVATSGLDYRRWERGGRRLHHLIDPRTGRPAETDLLSVSVIAPTAWQAEVHAKVALLLGTAGGFAYLTRQPDTEGLLVTPDGLQRATPGLRRYRAEP